MMHNTMVVGLDKAYLRKLRIVMDPNNRKSKARVAANIRKEMPAMLELHKLETELASKAGRRSPTDTFIMKKRIKQIVEEERKAGPVPDVCEAITIGGAYET